MEEQATYDAGKPDVFTGRTYWYPTPNDGKREIGVCAGLGGSPIVAWVADSGAPRRVRTPHLPAGIPAAELQARLQRWATARNLEVAHA